MFNQPLPEHYLITPEPNEENGYSEFLAHLSITLSSGIHLVQLRAKKMEIPAYTVLAKKVLAICKLNNARLILNGPISYVDANKMNADGLHLSSARLMACTERPLIKTKLVSAACHTLAELFQAQYIGVDFVTLSPILATTSHPDAQLMGWEQFTKLVASVQIPIYALGGMTKKHTSFAKLYGAQGIAAISGLWKDN